MDVFEAETWASAYDILRDHSEALDDDNPATLDVFELNGDRTGANLFYSIKSSGLYCLETVFEYVYIDHPYAYWLVLSNCDYASDIYLPVLTEIYLSFRYE